MILYRESGWFVNLFLLTEFGLFINEENKLQFIGISEGSALAHPVGGTGCVPKQTASPYC